MTNTSAPERGDNYLAAGTWVRLDSYFNGDDTATPEFGVVIHCWLDEELGGFDCYVAFFGDGYPKGKPVEKPYVLRYAANSLAVVA